MTGTNLQVDTLVTDLHDRQVVEKLLASKAGPGHRGARDGRGVRRRRERLAAQDRRHRKVTDPACRGAAYLKPDATALDIWYGVYLANLIASTGHFLPQITEATPPSANDPGIPGCRWTQLRSRRPTQLPDQRQADGRARQGPESPFGSNATAIGGDGSTTGPRHGARQPALPVARPLPVHPAAADDPGLATTSPARSLIGSPVVNIGWNKDVAWSHTVSTAYRFTPYEYQTARHPHVVPHHRRASSSSTSAT